MLTAFAALGGVGAAPTAINAAQGQYGKKVTICHKGKKTITVSKKALPAHLRHGDTIGTCARGKKAKKAKAAKAKAAKAKAAKAKAAKAKAAKARPRSPGPRSPRLRGRGQARQGQAGKGKGRGEVTLQPAI